MLGRKKMTNIGFLLLIGLLGLCSCGSPSSNSESVARIEGESNTAIETVEVEITKEASTEETAEFLYESSMELQYAENFKVDYYTGGYTLLTTIMDNRKFLIVPEGKKVPEDLEEDVVVLQRPIKDLYLVASSVMDMFCELNGLDTITFSGQKEESWYVEDAKQAMARGDMVYAGKYNKPDYELMVAGNCTLAIENMMISHSPEVMEKLEDFGIPVMIEYSSYESHPLGRVEWIKFFGALLGKEAEAEQAFQDQVAILEKVATDEKTDKTVAFFFVTSNGLVQVRQSSDYVPKMIELAGGSYIFENLGDPESKRSTMNMQIEEFYNGAKDADFLIYNSSIDGGVATIDELLDKCAVLKDFKAVQEGKVWCTTNDMYQQSMSIGYLIEDIHTMLQEKEEEMKYLFRLE
ncbi:MAG: ABC transporter substrate-binding protein [Lachnospiraceae bacterium]|nr:ABC transporter substrate-binding protein [Lachnospiraceae bacterium]